MVAALSSQRATEVQQHDDNMGRSDIISGINKRSERSYITEKWATLGIPERQALMEAPGAWWNAKDVGLPGTRKDILEAMMRWTLDPEDKPIYWLTGVAGSGKSTIASTLAQSLQDRLGACFFFNRKLNLLNTFDRLITTLARQLSRYNSELATAIALAVQKNEVIGSFPLGHQMHELIVLPMQAVKFPKPVVIILDALDEGGSRQKRKELLDAFATELQKLPSYVKVLITSRDEPDIRAILGDMGISSRADVKSETEGDIRAYLKFRLSCLSKQYPHIPNDWPGEQSLDELVRRADGLFIWASVACNFIDDNYSYDPDLGLQKLTSLENADRGEAEGGLDNLYLTVLRGAFASQTGDTRNHFQHVVGAIVAVKEPLAIQTLDALLGLRRDTLQAPLRLPEAKLVLTSSAGFISNLNPILRNDEASEGRVRVLHASIIDFFLDKQRSKEFHIDISGRNRMLAGRCIDRMRAFLKRDICSFNSPTKLNRDIEDLEARIRAHFPRDFQYACRFWAEHLADAPHNDQELLLEVRNFVFQHFLHWLEVMSLLNAIDYVVPMLELVERWLSVCPSFDMTLTNQ
jgi:energy-coupling factor transporter ATP-binding protein EcfA2